VPLIQWPAKLDADGTFHVSVEVTRALFLMIGEASDYYKQQYLCHHPPDAPEAPTSRPATPPSSTPR
jgi:hypothetical protein